MPKNGKALFLGEGEAQTTPKGGIKLWQWRRDIEKMRNQLHWISTLELVSWISAIKRAFDFFPRERKWNGSGVQGRNSTFLAQRGAQLSDNFNLCGDCGVCKYHRAPGTCRLLTIPTIPHDPQQTCFRFLYIGPSFQSENLLVRLDVHSRGHLQSWAVQGSTWKSTIRNHCNTSLLS